MNDYPLVSIIVPVYNTEKYVEKCLNSIISQTYMNLEIIIVNDGSTDNSINICKNFQDRDDRIKIIHQENAGLSAARNTGISNAKGEYIAFIDSDDFVDCKFIELLINAIIDKNTLLSICDLYLYNGINDIEVVGDLDSSTTFLDPAKYNGEFHNVAWRKLYHKSILKNIKFPVGIYHEDIGVWSGIMGLCDKIAIVNAPLYFYRKNNINSITRKKNIKRSFDGLESYEYGLLLMEKFCKPERKKIIINALLDTYYQFPFLNSNKKWIKNQKELLLHFNIYSQLLTKKNKIRLKDFYCRNYRKLKKHIHVYIKSIFGLIWEPLAIVKYAIYSIFDFVSFAITKK